MEAPKFKNYDDCLMGYVEIHGSMACLYDKHKLLKKIIGELKCDLRSAEALLYSNIGPAGPALFLKTPPQVIDVEISNV